jgi:hypothetical protein
MRTHQLSYSEAHGWRSAGAALSTANLVLYFGTRAALSKGARFQELRDMFPGAHIVGCSTGGQIRNDDISDDEIAAVALQFDATRLRVASEPAPGPQHSRRCGEAIGRALKADDLAGIFVLSDGLNVNGSELVAGITGIVGAGVPLTGGLAGDGARFAETMVSADCAPRTGIVGAVGFYGDAIRIGHGSAGGWDVFGPRRRVTRSRGNVVLELDGQPALDLYERYLDAEEVKGLPGTALRFPLQIQDPHCPAHEVIRTVLAIDRDERSLTFAGDVPEGWMARLMRGNFDHLAAGAADAARQAYAAMADGPQGDEISLVVSCVGRRLLMGQRITDELDAIDEVRPGTRLGFFSYGEIAPHAASGLCELHNQIMTVTSIREAAA